MLVIGVAPACIPGLGLVSSLDWVFCLDARDSVDLALGPPTGTSDSGERRQQQNFERKPPITKACRPKLKPLEQATERISASGGYRGTEREGEWDSHNHKKKSIFLYTFTIFVQRSINEAYRRAIMRTKKAFSRCFQVNVTKERCIPFTEKSRFFRV